MAEGFAECMNRPHVSNEYSDWLVQSNLVHQIFLVDFRRQLTCYSKKSVQSYKEVSAVIASVAFLQTDCEVVSRGHYELVRNFAY